MQTSEIVASVDVSYEFFIPVRCGGRQGEEHELMKRDLDSSAEHCRFAAVSWAAVRRSSFSDALEGASFGCDDSNFLPIRNTTTCKVPQVTTNRHAV